MDGSVVTQIIIQIVLIMLNAVFACAEIAIISMNDAKLAQLVAKGDKRAIRLAHLTSKPAKFLATIQVAITLSGFLGSAFAADGFSDLLVQGLIQLGVKVPESTLNTISVIVITIILSYFTLVFGELVPKRVAMKKAESLALGMASMVYFISKLFAPVVWLLTASTNGMLRLFGIDPNEQDEKVTEEEIRMMVDLGSEKGTIDVEEKELIQNVFEFDDLTAGEIATHRTEISMLWLEESDEQWEKTVCDSRHTFYPVCGETVDQIVGVLDAKIYFRLKDKSRESVMKNAVKPAYFVPESVKADVLFRNMKKLHESFSVVIDEYGGMSGIVTVTDLLECIVGDFSEPNDGEHDSAPVIEPIDSQTWKISGNALIEEVEKTLNVDLNSEDCDTFSGYVFAALGSIPEDGTSVYVETDKLIVKVTDIKNRKVRKATVCLPEKPKIEEEK